MKTDPKTTSATKPLPTPDGDFYRLKEILSPEERARALGAPGVTGHGDALMVGVDAQVGGGGKDVVEVVEDRVQVGDPNAPDRGEARVVEPDAVAA